mgnify:CR=1 FL=1
MSGVRMGRDLSTIRLVALLGVMWVTLQGWLLTAHWINADEGAHLMAGVHAGARDAPDAGGHVARVLPRWRREP